MTNHEPCPRIEALSALSDGELQAAERAAVELHVAGCAVCAPVLERMRELHAQFAALPERAVDFDLAAQVDRRIGELSRPLRAPGRASPRRRWWQAAALAPGGALALAAGLWLGASIVPAATSATTAQMAAFSPLPPGALCPVAIACARPR